MTTSSPRSVVAALIVLGLAAFGQPHAAKTLKIATVSPDGSAWMRVLREAAGEVDAATEGRVKFRFYPGGVMGDDTQVLRKMRIRQLHGGIVITSAFASIYRDIQIYNLPMAFRSLDEVDAVRKAMDPLLIAGLADAGFVAFGIAEVGMAYPMSTKVARTVAEARKLKVWLPQGDEPMAQILKAFKIAPIPGTIGDVLINLQSGLIDTVAAPPVAAVPLQWHTRLKYVLDLPLLYIYGLFVVSESSLRGIDPADRAAMQRIMSAATTAADRRNRADHGAAWQTLADQGLAFIRPTPREIEDWRSHARTASEQWVEKGVVSEEIYATLTAKLAEVRAAGGDRATRTAAEP